MDPVPDTKEVREKEGKGRVSSSEWSEERSEYWLWWWSSSSVSHDGGCAPPDGPAPATAPDVGLYSYGRSLRFPHRPPVRGLIIDEAMESVTLPMLTERREPPVKGVSIPPMAS